MPRSKHCRRSLSVSFDPEQRTFRTLTQPAIPLSVRPGAAAPAQPTILAGGAQSQDAPPPAKDIVHIKSRLGVVAQIRPSLLVQPWFLALQGLPLALWLAAILWRKRQDKLAKDPRLRRRLRVEQVVRAGVRDLARLAAANQTEEFFATVFRLLQEQLGERLDLPASAITEAVLTNVCRAAARHRNWWPTCMNSSRSATRSATRRSAPARN